MALNALGVIRIADEPTIFKLDNGGVYFNCTAESNNPKKKGSRYYYKLSVYVAANLVDEAKEKIVQGRSFYINASTIEGIRSQKDVNIIFNQVQTTYWDLGPLSQTFED